MTRAIILNSGPDDHSGLACSKQMIAWEGQMFAAAEHGVGVFRRVKAISRNRQPAITRELLRGQGGR